MPDFDILEGWLRPFRHPQAGVVATVYRQFEDRSHGGLSSLFPKLIISGEGLPKLSAPSATCPALRLVMEQTASGVEAHAEPFEQPPIGFDPYWYWGGNFAYVDDARVWAICGHHPIPIHDYSSAATNDRLRVWPSHFVLRWSFCVGEDRRSDQGESEE